MLPNQTRGFLGRRDFRYILCLDKTTTGDGLISALQVLAIMKQTGSGLAELAGAMEKYPQVLLNVKVLNASIRRANPAWFGWSKRWNGGSTDVVESYCALQAPNWSFG